MSRQRISILSPNLSGNALGRAYVLAKLLQEDFHVQVVGFNASDDIWAPVRNDTTIEYRRFYYATVPEFWLNASRTVKRLVEGQLILAVKPVHQSFGLGLYARRLLSRPLLLDIDDWEIGFLSNSVYWEFRLQLLKWFLSSGSPLFTRVLDRLTWKADAITVSNSFLQNRYGGTWVPHARDEHDFDPRHFPDLGHPGTPNLRTVLFLGTARQNKGLPDLVSAWRQVHVPDAVLRIIGTPLDSPLIQALLTQADHTRTCFEGPVSFERLPSIIASASIIVIPQQLVSGSVGQLPAKLIDAMAAGRPVISTAVGDIPLWLADGAGLVVSPGDPSALAKAIQRLLEDRALGTLMGQRARVRFLRYGSYSVVRPRLVKLVSDLIARRSIALPEPVFSETERSGQAPCYGGYAFGSGHDRFRTNPKKGFCPTGTSVL